MTPPPSGGGTIAPFVRFIDHTTLLCTAGRGGQGCRSHYRDLWMRHQRPDGGDGGHGGDVLLRADPNVPTLLDLAYRKHLQARPGRHGSSKRQRGADGEDLVIPVPPGTLVCEAETGDLLQDLTHAGETVIVAHGGQGGVGNAHRREVTFGEPGEARRIRLELKLVADLGIVGLPNAGKSTLLRAISAARPRVAAFPFTTTTPMLGVVEVAPRARRRSTKSAGRPAGPVRCVAVDVPGLIEGAARGRGLGLEFLRHIERTRALLHVVDAAGSEGRDPVEDLRVLNEELAQYGHGVADKPQLIVANKADLPGAAKGLARLRRAVWQPIVVISAKTGEGIPAMLTAAAALLQKVA